MNALDVQLVWRQIPRHIRKPVKAVVFFSLGLAMLFGLVIATIMASELDVSYWVALVKWWAWAARLIPLIAIGVALLAHGIEVMDS